jgi:hypothetical protein
VGVLSVSYVDNVSGSEVWYLEKGENGVTVKVQTWSSHLPGRDSSVAKRTDGYMSGGERHAARTGVMSSLCGLCPTSIPWMSAETIAVAHHSCILSIEAKALTHNSDRVIPVRVPPEHTPAVSRTALLLCPAVESKILCRRFPRRRVQTTGDFKAQPLWISCGNSIVGGGYCRIWTPSSEVVDSPLLDASGE